MKSFFLNLFEYSHQCNLQLADFYVENEGQVSERSKALFSHVLNAHQIWNNRIDPQVKPFGVWQIHAVDQYIPMEQTNYQQTLQILEKYDLEAPVSYSNTRGQSFNQIVQDILFHVVNHSTYHRGQIASDFRQGGLDPIITDYIFYKRGVK